MVYYGKKSCSEKCESNCCYFTKPGFLLNRQNEKEVKRLEEIVRKMLGEFRPEYRDKIKRIVEAGIVARRSFGNYLRCDSTKLGFDSAMIPYYPCVFLSDSEKFSNENKACMIYPHRFSFCRNATIEDCFPGLSSGRRKN